MITSYDQMIACQEPGGDDGLNDGEWTALIRAWCWTNAHQPACGLQGRCHVPGSRDARGVDGARHRGPRARGRL